MLDCDILLMLGKRFFRYRQVLSRGAGVAIAQVEYMRARTDRPPPPVDLGVVGDVRQRLLKLCCLSSARSATATHLARATDITVRRARISMG